MEQEAREERNDDRIRTGEQKEKQERGKTEEDRGRKEGKRTLERRVAEERR